VERDDEDDGDGSKPWMSSRLDSEAACCRNASPAGTQEDYAPEPLRLRMDHVGVAAIRLRGSARWSILGRSQWREPHERLVRPLSVVGSP
jgi:hypothetical protein